MTETARVYGGSLYELAAEEHLEEEILSEMKEIRALFRENPEYPRLLSEPSIPRKERIGLTRHLAARRNRIWSILSNCCVKKIFSVNSADARKHSSADTTQPTILLRQL